MYRKREYGWINGLHVIEPRNYAFEERYFGKKALCGLNFDDYDKIPVDLVGESKPSPIKNFQSAKLNSLLSFIIRLIGYTKLTPIQKYAIPILQRKRDMMGCAQTGSGKTACYLLPILSHMFNTGPKLSYSVPCHPSALILFPTRELAKQIYNEAEKFTYRAWVKPAVVYGGVSINNQIAEIESGCDLLVATPGRLIDLIKRGHISLSAIKFLVLDEADMILDMGFMPQISEICNDFDMPETGSRQTAMFSATFPNSIQMLAKQFLSNYVFLSVGRIGATSENIKQKIYPVSNKHKRTKLLKLLDSLSHDLILVFVETKRMAAELNGFLNQQKYNAATIHGDCSQAQREYSLNAFENGEVNILVATSVAARGLDIPKVTLVINYDLPRDIDSYVHRIGRTGRVGNTGLAISFYDPTDKPMAKKLINVLQESKQEVPGFLYVDVVPQNKPKHINKANQQKHKKSENSIGKGNNCLYADTETKKSKQKKSKKK